MQRGFEFRQLFILFTVKPSNFQGCKKRCGLATSKPGSQDWWKTKCGRVGRLGHTSALDLKGHEAR